MAMLLSVSVPGPLFVNVTFCAALVVFVVWLGKVNELGDRPTADPVPVPLSGTDCGVPGPLSPTLSDALREPAADGVNVMLMLQEEFAASVAGQPLLCEKSPALVPLIVILAMLKVPEPEFDRVTVCAALVEPTG